MIYTTEVQHMCPVAKGAYHGPAPIPEEGKWVQAKQISDISGFTHGVGWCAPQQGACKLTLNVKNGIIEEALVETLGCSGMTHSAAMASEILIGKTLLEALNTDLVCDAINTAMRELFLQIVYGRTQSAFSEDGLPIVINENGEETTYNINFQEWEKLDFLKYEGPVDPPFTGGFGNNIRWKNLNLNVFFTYSFGSKVRLDPSFSASYSDLDAMPREFMDRWVQAGDEDFTNIPAIASRRQVYNNSQIGYGYNAYNYSTERVAKGDFIRLKEISLTYQFPTSWTRALRISNASLKLAATDIWLCYSDKKLQGQDPEFVNSGGVASPNPKQFTFTLRFGL